MSCLGGTERGGPGSGESWCTDRWLDTYTIFDDWAGSYVKEASWNQHPHQPNICEEETETSSGGHPFQRTPHQKLWGTPRTRS